MTNVHLPVLLKTENGKQVGYCHNIVFLTGKPRIEDYSAKEVSYVIYLPDRRPEEDPGNTPVGCSQGRLQQEKVQLRKKRKAR